MNQKNEMTKVFEQGLFFSREESAAALRHGDRLFEAALAGEYRSLGEAALEEFVSRGLKSIGRDGLIELTPCDDAPRDVRGSPAMRSPRPRSI